ncbi:hypothetical protein [Streptosporangium roseum]|uniref:hypothetical protein n=1 Tax=Streptosporangium roseum TaxID=2001 RepID=UPI003321C1DC
MRRLNYDCAIEAIATAYARKLPAIGEVLAAADLVATTGSADLTAASRQGRAPEPLGRALRHAALARSPEPEHETSTRTGTRPNDPEGEPQPTRSPKKRAAEHGCPFHAKLSQGTRTDLRNGIFFWTV